MDNILLNDIVDILNNILDDILDILNNILDILFQTYEAEEGERIVIMRTTKYLFFLLLRLARTWDKEKEVEKEKKIN